MVNLIPSHTMKKMLNPTNYKNHETIGVHLHISKEKTKAATVNYLKILNSNLKHLNSIPLLNWMILCVMLKCLILKSLWNPMMYWKKSDLNLSRMKCLLNYYLILNLRGLRLMCSWITLHP